MGVVYKARAARVSKRFPLVRDQPLLGDTPLFGSTLVQISLLSV